MTIGGFRVVGESGTQDSGAAPDVLASPEDLQAQIRELREAVEARDKFLSMAAHELRNPMTPILGQVQRLRRLAASQHYEAKTIEDALSRVEILVLTYIKRATTLLDVSRITSGKFRLEVGDWDVGEIVRNTVQAHEPAAEFAGSTIELAAPPSVHARTDGMAVQQVVDNLLNNAIKYGEGSTIRVVLRSEGDAFCVCVSDSGRGIPTDMQERLFQRFERAIKNDCRGGFGVGLWVVGQLVDALGGQVSVDSAAGRGTTFVVQLPRVISAASAS